MVWLATQLAKMGQKPIGRSSLFYMCKEGGAQLQDRNDDGVYIMKILKVSALLLMMLLLGPVMVSGNEAGQADRVITLNLAWLKISVPADRLFKVQVNNFSEANMAIDLLEGGGWPHHLELQVISSRFAQDGSLAPVMTKLGFSDAGMLFERLWGNPLATSGAVWQGLRKAFGIDRQGAGKAEVAGMRAYWTGPSDTGRTLYFLPYEHHNVVFRVQGDFSERQLRHFLSRVRFQPPEG